MVNLIERNTYLKSQILNVIRLQSEDFDSIKKNTTFLNHFNLQSSGHEVGIAYLLTKILKRGYFKSKEDQVLPELDIKNSYVGVCVEVKNNLSYNDLTKEDFKFSFSHIKDVESLKKAIIDRYSSSMPNLSKEEILSLGISLTKLKIIGKLSKDHTTSQKDL